MKKLTKIMIALVAMAVLGISCSRYPGFKKDKDGLYYKFHVTNKKEAQPQVGDVVEMTYSFRIIDSVLVENAPLYDRVREQVFSGDIYSAIRKMHLGDSATFIMNGDTFFHYFYGQPFPFERKEFYCDLKLISIMPFEEYENLQAERAQQYEAMVEGFRLAEDSLMNDYIMKNNIKVKPTANGLYFMKKESGKGKMITNGSKVAVHYTGKLLDGMVFDSSLEYGSPLELIVGQGNVIPGWEEALLLMRQGDKATLLIPSKLAYGGRGASYVIMPYTPLVFDMEVMSVE
jgi:FKBP-type peptidyl-prolyl cis-trans isomerase